MSDWSLRPAVPADAAALARCVDAAYAIYTDQISDLPPVSDGLAEDIRDHCVWVVEDQTRLLGGLVLILSGKTAKLANLAVLREASGKGIGKALINTAENHARSHGATHITLATHKDMPGNIALYQHLGWAETKRVGNRVFMNKPL